MDQADCWDAPDLLLAFLCFHYARLWASIRDICEGNDSCGVCGHVHNAACHLTSRTELTVDLLDVGLWLLSGIFSWEIKDVKYLDRRKTTFFPA